MLTAIGLIDSKLFAVVTLEAALIELLYLNQFEALFAVVAAVAKA